MILVTGATGLLGSYLVKDLLKQGKHIRGLKRSTSNLALLGNYASQIEWVTGDVTDTPSLDEAMQGIEQVYHCAAVISFAKKDTDAMMKTNIEGTANVMNAALAANVNRVVHVSSVAAFGLHKPNKFIDEKTVYAERKDMFHYYRSKQLSEREAWRAQAEGLDVVIANPSTIIGAGWWDMEPNSVFQSLHNGLAFYTKGSVGFVDVRDTVNCLIAIMQKGINGEQYIVHAENMTYKTLLQQAAKAIGAKPPHIEVSESIGKAGVIYEWLKAKITGKKQLLTPEMARLASMDFAFSNYKITTQLGVTFRPMQQTISDTAVAFLKSIEENKPYGVFY